MICDIACISLKCVELPLNMPIITRVVGEFCSNIFSQVWFLW